MTQLFTVFRTTQILVQVELCCSLDDILDIGYIQRLERWIFGFCSSKIKMTNRLREGEGKDSDALQEKRQKPKR